MKKKVLIGISGGVDSSVAAYILQKKGYEVIGVTLDLWNENSKEENTHKDAVSVAQKLGIKHFIFDYKEKFKKDIIDYFIKEYFEGNTPNPCILCNKKIKWEILLEKADELGCEFVATGHYAKINYDKTTNSYELIKGDDPKKDQSYFLYKLKQKELSRILFPLYEIEKSEVREIAKELGLVTAEKKESMEICFIPDNDYRKFLLENSNGNLIKKGDMYNLNNEKLKKHKHDGFPFYTVGQRKGLGGGFEEPMYVAKTDAKTNRVYIAKRESLFTKEVFVKDVTWTNSNNDKIVKCETKIRFNTIEKPCTITKIDDNNLKIIFNEPVFAVTPGQSAVFYDNGKVLGGGIIINRKNNE